MGASLFGKSSRSFAARVPVAGALRQFPQLSGINTISPYAAPLGFSHYHSLQMPNRQVHTWHNLIRDSST